MNYKCETCDAWMEDDICPIHNTPNKHVNDYLGPIQPIDISNPHKTQSTVQVEGIRCEKCNKAFYTPTRRCPCGGSTHGFVVHDVLPGSVSPGSMAGMPGVQIKKQVKLDEIQGTITVKV